MTRNRIRHYPPLDVAPSPLNEGWTIRACPSGSGAVDLVTKTMYVPMGPSVHDRNVRLHELAHVLWSWGRPLEFVRRYKLRGPVTYQAMEDARIQDLLVLSGIDLGEGFLPRAQLRALVEASVSRGDYAGVCLFLVAGAFSGSEDGIRRVLRAVALIEGADSPCARVIRLADDAVARIAKEPKDPQVSGKTARWIEDRFRKLGWLRPDGNSTGPARLIKPPPGGHADEPSPPDLGEGRSLARRHGKAGMKEHGSTPAETTRAGRVDARAYAEAGEKRPAHREILERLLRLESGGEAEPGVGFLAGSEAGLPSGIVIAGIEKGSQSVPWGRLEVETPPLVSRLPGRIGRRWRAAQEGTRILAPHRMLTDDRVFGRKRRAQGGTVLIDASGSMCLSVEDLWSIVENAPGATVAVYAGDGPRGSLRILARNGRIVSRDACRTDHMGMMNVVDGPALCWLARLSRPRLWVSDGRVTGINDRTSRWNRREAERIARDGGIQRIATVHEAVALLRRLARRTSKPTSPASPSGW